MKVEIATRAEPWDEYVSFHGAEHPYHRWVWRKVIEQSFGHHPYYLTATAGAAIRGVLPLVWMKSRLFGRFLVSIPFFSYGGILADDADTRAQLVAAAEERAKELGANHIELRQGEKLPLPWNETSEKVTMELELPRSIDDYWGALSSGMRNKVRRAQKCGLRAAWNGMESLPVFYEIFAANMHNLGTPVYPRSFFENQMSLLSDKIRILTIWDGERAVAAGFVTAHRDRLELPWSASLLDSRKSYSAVFMYWTLIERAISEGFATVDFGRCSRDSGTYEFKRHWNPIERPLHWYYWLAPGAPMPVLRPENSKYRLAVAIWKRLPLSVANGLGPRLVRSIP